MRRLIVVFTISLIISAQVGCSSKGDRAANTRGEGSGPSAPATPVSAAELIEAYRANESKADEKYKGKTLAVTGTVSGKGTDFNKNPYVELKADNPIIEVHCNYTDPDDASMAALKDGQQATITGVCAGRLSTWVILKESALQK